MWATGGLPHLLFWVDTPHNAAMAASKAAKKSSGGSSKTASKGASTGGASKGGAAKGGVKSAAKGGAAKGAASKSGAAKGGASKGGASKAGASKAGAAKGGAQSGGAAKSRTNHGNPWSAEDMRQLRTLARERTLIRVAAERLGRSLDSVKSKASEEGISFKGPRRAAAAGKRGR